MPTVHGDEAARVVGVEVETRVDVTVSTREQLRPGAVGCVGGQEGLEVFCGHLELPYPDEHERYSSTALRRLAAWIPIDAAELLLLAVDPLGCLKGPPSQPCGLESWRAAVWPVRKGVP
jgi:hypothetical protein